MPIDQTKAKAVFQTGELYVGAEKEYRLMLERFGQEHSLSAENLAQLTQYFENRNSGTIPSGIVNISDAFQALLRASDTRFEKLTAYQAAVEAVYGGKGADAAADLRRRAAEANINENQRSSNVSVVQGSLQEFVGMDETRALENAGWPNNTFESWKTGAGGVSGIFSRITNWFTGLTRGASGAASGIAGNTSGGGFLGMIIGGLAGFFGGKAFAGGGTFGSIIAVVLGILGAVLGRNFGMEQGARDEGQSGTVAIPTAQTATSPEQRAAQTQQTTQAQQPDAALAGAAPTGGIDPSVAAQALAAANAQAFAAIPPVAQQPMSFAAASVEGAAMPTVFGYGQRADSPYPVRVPL